MSGSMSYLKYTSGEGNAQRSRSLEGGKLVLYSITALFPANAYFLLRHPSVSMRKPTQIKELECKMKQRSSKRWIQVENCRHLNT
jgi:hypothetical protein